MSTCISKGVGVWDMEKREYPLRPNRRNRRVALGKGSSFFPTDWNPNLTFRGVAGLGL